jgi:exodeoxyribonuclease VII small subunit
MSFEESVIELKSLVTKLQSSDVCLDNLVQYYESGLKLKQHAYHLLNTAKVKIEKIQSHQHRNDDKINEYKDDAIMICEKFIDNCIELIKNKSEIDYNPLVLTLKSKFNEIRECVQTGG